MGKATGAVARKVSASKALGVTRTTLFEWKKKGILAYDASGAVDVAETMRRREAYSRQGLNKERAMPVATPVATPAVTKQSSEDEYGARLRKEIALADLREMERDRESGKLVELSAMLDTWFVVLRGLRDNFLGLSNRIAARVAATADIAECRIIIDLAVRDILENIEVPDATAINAVETGRHRGDDTPGDEA